jgi:O-antigen biosynthesis protein
MRAATPLLDVLLLYGGNVIIKEYWEQTIKAEEGVHYPLEFMLYVLPSYILIWLFSSYLSGAYDRPVKPLKAIRGVVAGTLAILVIYALLPEGMRFSRALILLGAVWAMISLPASRVLLHLSGLKYFRLAGERNKRFAVAGSREEIERVREILNTTYPGKSFIAPVSLEKTGDEYFSGHLEQLTEICAIYGIDEVVFCSKDIPSQTIITLMTRLNAGHTDFKIAPADSIALIGSSSIHTAGDVYIHSLQTVISPQNRRNKRLTDLVTSLILLVLLPIIIWFTGKPGRTLIHLLQVFSGKKTWVGYNLSQGVSSSHLPPLKPAVLPHTLIYPLKNADNETLNRLNMLYARDYTFSQDIAILIRCIKYIGR